MIVPAGYELIKAKYVPTIVVHHVTTDDAIDAGRAVVSIKVDDIFETVVFTSEPFDEVDSPAVEVIRAQDFAKELAIRTQWDIEINLNTADVE